MSLASLRLETQSFLNVELASLVPRPFPFPFPCTASIDRLQYGNTVGEKKLLVPSTLLQEHTVQESHVRCHQVVQKCIGGGGYPSCTAHPKAGCQSVHKADDHYRSLFTTLVNDQHVTGIVAVGWLGCIGYLIFKPWRKFEK